MKNETKQKKRENLFRFFWAASFFSGLGIYLVMTVAATMWLGYKFDEFFGTEPKGLIVGIMIGFPVAVYAIYEKVRLYFGKKGN